ncbi:MAG: ABC transporter ATP-binding protein [Candidatus Ryanbacteria bacterium]|nr:ABC transporter ATP-binding protein [Candidatus Ryanbacteria bacterium]
MLALDIQNLLKKYGDVTAVDDISFSIPQGQFFGFLGPNGAGKTTTIKCITGIAGFQSGKVSVFGIDVVKEYREARKKIGLAPQEFNIDIFANVRDILYYIAGFYGIPESERKERIDGILEKFDLTAHASKTFQMLSGGLKRRTMLARAMIHDPDMLILDEPTAGVDVELRHDLWRCLRDLNLAGKTILLTSHYLEEVELLCNRIAIINQGKIAAIGDKEEFISGGRKLEQAYLDITKSEKSR